MSDLKIVNFRLSKETSERLTNLAKEQQTTVTAIIRELILKCLKKANK